MEIKELYEEYGRLLIRLEILQNKINEVKRKIAEGLNNKDEKIANAT